MTLAEWIPISTESVVANSLQTSMRCSSVYDLHSSGGEEGQLSRNASVWLGIEICQEQAPENRKPARTLARRRTGRVAISIG